MSADKLIDTINQAIQRAGGEAARVWPQMVESWRFEGFVLAAVCIVVATVLGGICAFACAFVKRYGFDGPEDTAPAAALALMAAVFMFVLVLIAAQQITHIRYPEAMLIRSLIGSR